MAPQALRTDKCVCVCASPEHASTPAHSPGLGLCTESGCALCLVAAPTHHSADAATIWHPPPPFNHHTQVPRLTAVLRGLGPDHGTPFDADAAFIARQRLLLQQQQQQQQQPAAGSGSSTAASGAGAAAAPWQAGRSQLAQQLIGDWEKGECARSRSSGCLCPGQCLCATCCVVRRRRQEGCPRHRHPCALPTAMPTCTPPPPQPHDTATQNNDITKHNTHNTTHHVHQRPRLPARRTRPSSLLSGACWAGRCPQRSCRRPPHRRVCSVCLLCAWLSLLRVGAPNRGCCSPASLVGRSALRATTAPQRGGAPPGTRRRPDRPTPGVRAQRVACTLHNTIAPRATPKRRCGARCSRCPCRSSWRRRGTCRRASWPLTLLRWPRSRSHPPRCSRRPLAGS
jgi:hypothetical protein